MKLIVVGATGLVGTEVIKQSLKIPDITSVIALARRPVNIEDIGLDTCKLNTVVIKDYGHYPDDVKAEFAGANACIWTVAITPFRINEFEFPEIKRVCQTCTIAGFKAIYEAGPERPFRFIYLSAEGTPLELSKKPWILGDYQIMRGETEHMVLALDKDYQGIEVCIAHPGIVTNTATWARAALAGVFRVINTITLENGPPNVSRAHLSAALLGQAVDGFEKQMLTNDDLVRIGKSAYKGYVE